MNNKKIGTNFEREVLDMLAAEGWWAHFISPDRSGAQPFDIIAMKDSTVMAIDCKTCAEDSFALSRIEDNQFMAFQTLLWRTQAYCGFAILHNADIYLIPFEDVLQTLKQGKGSIKLTEEYKENAGNRIECHKN